MYQIRRMEDVLKREAHGERRSCSLAQTPLSGGAAGQRVEAGLRAASLGLLRTVLDG